jgi:2-iminobutanoate/2-iminopropanoate deaminase
MPWEAIKSDNLPGHITWMTPAAKVGNILFVGGQVPRHPKTLEIPGDIQGQTRQCMENLKTVVEAGGGSMSDYIRFTVYITDMGNWADMNEVYREYINEEKPPARLCCQTGLNADYLVEIDGIAVID